ncbi:class I SAM-dependent methyltransferase [Lentibacillus halophilus]|uniref:Class I SAM-dependent methyltransferase n=1 Tax=Lentibacillus halophilus TaxID=295065 RepID=A0ABN0Z3G0_9BACI
MNQSFCWHRKAKDEWDDRADFWHERSKKMWDSGSRQSIIPFIRNHLKQGSNILDVGCADGYGAYKLHQNGYDVTGVDLSTVMIRQARAGLQHTGIEFLQGDACDLPAASKSTDGLMAINVLEWTETPSQALQEFSRVLKKDGLLFAGILGPTAGPRQNSYARLQGQPTICNTMMPWEFRQLASEYGFMCDGGFGVYKEGVSESHYQGLPDDLKQALTFMWVFMLRKAGDSHDG